MRILLCLLSSRALSCCSGGSIITTRCPSSLSGRTSTLPPTTLPYSIIPSIAETAPTTLIAPSLPGSWPGLILEGLA